MYRDVTGWVIRIGYLMKKTNTEPFDLLNGHSSVYLLIQLSKSYAINEPHMHCTIDKRSAYPTEKHFLIIVYFAVRPGLTIFPSKFVANKLSEQLLCKISTTSNFEFQWNLLILFHFAFARNIQNSVEKCSHICVVEFRETPVHGNAVLVPNWERARATVYLLLLFFALKLAVSE